MRPKAYWIVFLLPLILISCVDPSLRTKKSPQPKKQGLDIKKSVFVKRTAPVKCIEKTVAGRTVFVSHDGSEGWYYDSKTGPFYNPKYYSAGPRLGEIPDKYFEIIDGVKMGLKRGIRTYDDLKNLGVKFPEYAYPDEKWRAAIHAATYDKDYGCHKNINKVTVAKALKEMDEESKGTRKLVEQLSSQRAQKTAARRAKETARNQKISAEIAKKRNAQINEHLMATQQCRKPIYKHLSGTVVCNGKTLKPIQLPVDLVQPSYLIKTKMGLITLSPKMKEESKFVDVIAAHPNLTNRSIHQCPVCKGKGYSVSQRAIETRFAPKHTYRNNLKITEKTTITSTQKHYDGICGRCLGHGEVPSAWNGYNNR